jgi:hypothetical protein
MLARRSEVSVDAIERFENVSGSLKRTEIQAVQDTLEKLGASFHPGKRLGLWRALEIQQPGSRKNRALRVRRWICRG